MAMSATILQNSLMQAASGSLEGPFMAILAKAVADAVAQWPIGLDGVASGTSGFGSTNGTVSVPPVQAWLLLSLMDAGIQGTLAATLATVLANGLSQACSTATYAGQSNGVAVGTDTAKVTIADATVLSGLLLAAFGPSSGPLAPALSIGIANGFSAMLLAVGTGTGSVVGTPSLPTTSVVSATSSWVN